MLPSCRLSRVGMGRIKCGWLTISGAHLASCPRRSVVSSRLVVVRVRRSVGPVIRLQRRLPWRRNLISQCVASSIVCGVRRWHAVMPTAAERATSSNCRRRRALRSAITRARRACDRQRTAIGNLPSLICHVICTGALL